MNARPWIRWNGGAQPVADDAVVDTMLRTKRVYTGPASRMSRKYHGQEIGWRSVGDKYDIIAYRLSEGRQ